jgi:hypothetical protein
MDMEAYEVVKSYANISDIIQVEKYRGKEGVDVCRAIQELMEDSREQGVLDGKEAIVLNMLNQNLPIDKICLFTGCSIEFVNEVKENSVA